MKKIKMKNEQGFSLIETMITMALFFIVLGSVYTMVIHYGNVSRTENSRIRMQQESRYMMTNFTQEIQDAGAVLTAIPTFVKDVKNISFNGIYPLNQTDYPDGFIVASGDPDGVTYLDQAYSKAANGYFMTVKTVYKTSSAEYDPTKEYELRPWKPGDKAMLVNDDGYFIFRVKAVTYNTDSTDTIEMRDLPVYYSGLLHTQTSRSTGFRTYIDQNTGPSAITGNNVTYQEGSAVIRLASFAIYVFQDMTYSSPNGDRLIRQLVRVTDSKGEADVLLGTSTAEKSVISENIFDMQISYKTYESYQDFVNSTPSETPDPNFYYFGPTGTSSDLDALMGSIRRVLLKQVDISVVALSDDFSGKGDKINVVPALGDELGYNLPAGRYGYQIYSMSIDTWNFNWLGL
ncbi:MAG TPA: prepilin-type N-terminal cleavage/methylation domain-containing protein [Candidatus Deferrimicrobium sp.]|nr:prepilin-type N-terminal cleavage/methylation domain-containing protein [Candidatus Deferrimicrobium sp.]